jgi:hypothetical protein
MIEFSPRASSSNSKPAWNDNGNNEVDNEDGSAHGGPRRVTTASSSGVSGRASSRASRSTAAVHPSHPLAGASVAAAAPAFSATSATTVDTEELGTVGNVNGTAGEGSGVAVQLMTPAAVPSLASIESQQAHLLQDGAEAREKQALALAADLEQARAQLIKKRSVRRPGSKDKVSSEVSADQQAPAEN